MYIKNIVLDGFKSYAQRTEVSGFDFNFNAITGLNGSGKSNILDSICFLLGISNLHQVRASSLQELIYKNGQAGVTKATVTITFDNTDKKQSPIGYDSFNELTISRQIVLGGRNKYLINGSNANNQRVQDLFRTVQLNINNPHFVIMQGRITKVLNMKPVEILGMIEEAAGTKMYESKKQSALRTIEKKQSKLTEIEKILSEDITPQIAKLKQDRSNYMEYQKVMREIEHLRKLCIAYEFLRAEEMKKSSGTELEAMMENKKQLEERFKEIEVSVNMINEHVKELQQQKDAQSGGVLKELETKVNELSKTDVKVNSDLKYAKEALKGENKRKKEMEKNIADDEAQLKAKGKEISKREDGLKKLEDKSNADAEAIAAAQKHFHAVSAGLSSNADGEDKTLADQLMDCKNVISESDTEIKQANMKLKHNEGELKKKKADLKSTEKGYEKDAAVAAKLQKEKDKIEADLKKLDFQEGKERDLISKVGSLEKEVQQLRGVIENLELKFPHLAFDFRSPNASFDRSKVKGLVCRLMKVKDMKTATSLEVTAGGKLYNVVVDSEQTGKQLLEKGELKRRVTIIPLNKIASKSLNDDVVKKAKKLVGNNNVHTALSLVGYEKEIEGAMKFVFGSSFVCNAMDDAKKVTFDPEIKAKSVTLEGDVFDPAGTLTGGARAHKASVLEKLQELMKAQDQLQEKEKLLQDSKKKLATLKRKADEYNHLKQQFDLKSREAELVQERLKQTTHHHKVEEVKSLEQAIDEQKQSIEKANETKSNASKKAADLESMMKNAKQHREKELKKAEDEMTKAKQRAENSMKEFKAKEQEIVEMRLEVEELQNEIKSLQEQLKSFDESMAKLQEDVDSQDAKAKASKATLDEAKEELKKQKDNLKACSQAIGEKVKEQNELAKEASDVQLKLKELEYDISKNKKDSNDAAKRVENMLAKHDWISTEKEYFGQANTAYDFTATDPKEAQRKLVKLEETKDKLSKNVNMRAMTMLGKAEEKYNDLMKKKKIVEDDKTKIEEVIQELDMKKNEALQKAWEQVNKDFGSIYSTLLPGTNAKLSPPEGQSVLDGLEIKVAFGNVWKESLTELSGGQRSLVALSLILALLLFKPAPIYILDEVDAALDLSHTQNIGHMLRTHFKHSQFIVVSLKDGMFNNANVLYKTRFIDGVSTVTRYTQNNSGSKDTSKTLQTDRRQPQTSQARPRQK
eukprot:Seg2963.2 transcript_id=Seg2963.2/GoldUCD/mRNA.D3Y31 product="Structural maintenance of chromosomes protein 2" protein_id=Seg2963.2/GoldUCD/D3Y31